MYRPQVFDKFSAILCFALFLLAFLVRAYAADYGLFLGDERINEAAKVLTGKLIPDQHFYPPFINYLNGVAFGFLFVIGLAAGWWDGASGFQAQYFADPTAFYVTARLVTAASGALMAPLFYMTARSFGLDRGRSVAVGLVAVIFPLGVFMAHIAKGDTGLATALIALFWAIIVRLEAGRSLRIDALIGLFTVLALSFKHSAIFILFPLAIGLIVLLSRTEGTRQALASFGRAMLIILVLWPLLNIGLVLELPQFIAYQRIQSVMSVQSPDQSALVGLVTVLRRSFEVIFGMNPVMSVLAILTPVLLVRSRFTPTQKLTLGMIWVSLTIGTVIVAGLTGPRQPEHLWIANFAGFLLLGGVLLADQSRGPQRGVRAVAASLFAISAGFGLYGTAEVLRQAQAEPMHRTVGTYLAAEFPERRILTSQFLDIPQMREAQQLELDRVDRLARKYNIEVPPLAEERIISSSAPDAVFFVNMPGTMFGLENVDDDDLTYEVQAHAWPLQKQEWVLDYWEGLGFSIHVVQDFPYYAYESEPAMRRAYYQTLAETCRLLRVFEPAKPLFLESEVRVFDCYPT
jgi:hypothetical protein